MLSNYVDSARRARDKVGGVTVGGLEGSEEVLPSFGLGGNGIRSVDVLQ
jgi:hypothetical protein